MLAHSAAYLGFRVLNGVLALLSLNLLTRWLSAEQYGQYALAIAAAGAGTTVFYQWLCVASARLYPDYRPRAKALWRASAWWFGACSLALLVVAALCIPLARQRGLDLAMLGLIVATTVASGAHGLTIHVANAMQRPVLYGLLTSVRSAAALAAAAGLIALGWGTTGAIAGTALAAMLAVLLFAMAPRHTDAGVAPSGTAPTNAQLRRHLLDYGLPLSITYVATMVIGVSDRFFIGLSHGPQAVAAYAAAYDLAQQTTGALTNIFFLAGFPAMLVAQRQGDEAAARRHHAQMGAGVTLTAALLCALFIAGADDIAHIMFGSEMRTQAARLLPVIGAAIALSSFRGFYLDAVFQARQRTTVQLRITLAMAAVNLGANSLLVPLWGATGAAWGALISFLIGAVLSWIATRRIAPLPDLRQVITGAGIAGLGACGAMFALPPAGSSALVLARLAAGTLAFLAVVLLLDVAGMRQSLQRHLQRGRE